MTRILRLMGGLRVEPTGFAQPKPLLVLAYLALEGPQHRRRLAELFWPAGRRMKSLSMALTRLRQGAGDVVVADERRVVAHVATDVDALQDALRAGAWVRAHELYTGPFLEGVPDDDLGPDLEEWVVGTREHLAERVQQGLLELAEAAARAGRRDEAGTWAARAWRLPGAATPDAATLARLYRLLVAGRSPHARTVRRELEEYGFVVEAPAEGAVSLRGAPAGGVGPRDAVRGGGDVRRAHGARPASPNLTAPRTRFVGREVELDRVAAALAAADARLVTLVGAEGVGTSRLALEAAFEAHRSGRYPGGVHAVAPDGGGTDTPLADRVRAALAAAPWRDGEGRTVPGDLVGVPTLLLLDDVGDGVAAELGDLLAAAPSLEVLATARARLGLAEEDALAVAGLDLPAPNAPWSEAVATDAVRLFAERARQLQPALDLEPQAAAVVGLCRRLGGAPLALELAAPWTRFLTCGEMLARLEVDAPSDPVGATVAPGLRTLRRVLDMTWTLLDETDRVVARRLAVCRSGFRRDAAVAVAGATLPTLARLVDAAWLCGAPNGRYALHARVAAFLHERLEEDPDDLAATEARLRSHLGAPADVRARVETAPHSGPPAA